MYYRETTKRKAEALRLTGVAFNLADKRVEIYAEGPREGIETLVKWCWKGPEGAAEVGVTDKLTQKRRVSNVEVVWEKVDEGAARKYESFRNGGKKE